MSEREKMLRGDLYLSSDPELVAIRLKARQVLARYNNSDPADLPARASMLNELFGREHTELYIEPPFYCDYGSFITLGRNVYMNFGCTILDICPVHIGDYTLLAPHVHIYAASHPLDPASRRKGLECGAPVTIGADCWIGGHTVIVPGVSIGDGTTIGAGSVVTRDIPSGVLAAGNPCRVIRKL